jgi:peptide/nickel transport system substrate-binding protein
VNGARSRRVAATLIAALVLLSTAACGGDERSATDRPRPTTVTVDSWWTSPTLDPVSRYSPGPDSILGLTNDGLVGFRRAAGEAGDELVADLAQSLPASTDGGRTWRATLRPGLHYSTGQPVRASDVRRAIERDFRLRSDGVFALRKLVGANGCDSSPSTCSLADGIVTDDRTGAITFRLVEPDPEFPFVLALPLAYPLPPGTTNERSYVHPLPATGPYVVSSYVPKQELVLIRNPRFHQWSEAAQPAGVPDRIVYRLGVSVSDAIDDVTAGRAVSLIGVTAPDAPSPVDLSSRGTLFLELNTRVPPFDDVRARRAFAVALDRDAALRGGWERGYTPACHLVPPGIPPLTAERCEGKPDPVRARRMVRTSGTQGMSVAVAIEDGSLSRVIVRTLRSIGYRARLAPGAAGTFEDSDNRAQVGLYAWEADYASPANFFGALLTCDAYRPASPENQNGSRFCDPTLDELIAAAVTAGGTNPATAADRWRAVDRFVVRQAPVIPVGFERATGVTSPAARNVVWNPSWGLLVGQVHT